MDLKYIVSPRTDGANPFNIFEQVQHMDENKVSQEICRLPYSKFIQSAYWFAVSTVAKSKAGMRCQVCNSASGLQVHHRTYETHGKEHLNMIDLVVLCEYCHGLFHGHKPIERPRTPRKQEPRFPKEQSEIVIPSGEVFPLTRELINQCRANGSFTYATLNALGITKKTMVAGWVTRLIGTQIPKEKYQLATEGRFIYKTKLNKE